MPLFNAFLPFYTLWYQTSKYDV